MGFGGANGAGKTNLLDAIYLLSTGKSYFNVQDKQLIRYEATEYGVSGYFDGDDGENSAFQVKCTFRDGRKQLKVNEKVYERLVDHYGKIPLTLIAPQDTELITGGGLERRKFVDGLIAQYNHTYLEDLMRYNRGLQQRNALLKSEMNQRGQLPSEWLAPYDAQLSEHGSAIVRERKAFLENFLPLFRENYAAIGHEDEKIDILYEPGADPGCRLEDLLKERHSDDLRLKRTTVGPHRDDWRFLLHGRPVKKFGSQGQQKTYLLALKLTRHQLLAQQTQRMPILMLDDLFDRLDRQRIGRLLQWLKMANCGQVFFTDTDPERLEDLAQTYKIPLEIWHIAAQSVSHIDKS